MTPQAKMQVTILVVIFGVLLPGVMGYTECARCNRTKCQTIDKCPDPKKYRLTIDRCNCCMKCVDRSEPDPTPARQIRTCRAAQFACPRHKMCIPEQWVCDGQVDCPDGADEAQCPGSHNPCDMINCPKNKVCMLNIQGIPMCRCPNLIICKNKRRKNICGNDGQTYRNRCHLRVAECNSSTRIRVRHKGACVPKKKHRNSGRFKKYRPKKFGNGKRSRNNNKKHQKHQRHPWLSMREKKRLQRRRRNRNRKF